MNLRVTLLTICSAALLSGCLASTTQQGSAQAKTAGTSGSAGGATAQGENSQLEKCNETLGTIALIEDQRNWSGLYRYNLKTPVPVLRLLIQQSNCFVVVERGRAFKAMERERRIRNSGEMRAGSNFQKGQMVAADYSMTPSVTFAGKTGGAGGSLSSWGRRLGLGALGRLAGGVKFREASTLLTMVDNRSGVQLAAAEGSSRTTDYRLWGGVFGWGGAGSLGGYTKTPEGKVVAAALADSYNQLVRAVRNYKAQNVKGGLGTGGRLGVQGGIKPK
jgi:curli biogenesis system outer membrane secretion channel CsgG